MTISFVFDHAILDKLIYDTGGAVTRTVSDGVSYSIYQELGTTRMGAHPFMSPAVEAVRGGFMQAAGQIVSNTQAEAVVEKAARDVERGAKERAPFDTGALMNSIHVERQ